METITPAIAPAIDGERIASFLDRQVARVRPRGLVYLALFVLDFAPTYAISVLGHSIFGDGPWTAGAWLAEIVRRDLGRAIVLAVVLGPILESTLLWAVARGGRAIFRNADVAIVVAALILALTHLPADGVKIAAMSWMFFVQATLLFSRRLPYRFLTVLGIHSAHNAFIMAIVRLAG